MTDSLITYSVQPAFLHRCKNSLLCGASANETVINFASCTTAPPLRLFLRVPACPSCLCYSESFLGSPGRAPSGDYTGLKSPSMSRASQLFS